ncbi:MAG: hypothetical protein L6R42_009669 [Xanthoria sp. 1 TBL-2021]|nr:MAG: hypothetical protein L6R42_009669 [Xanthoria sp. 1 TBL-2021]
MTQKGLLVAPLLFLCGSAAPQGGDSNTLGPGGYICFQGSTFPPPQQWKSFEELATINQDSLGPRSSDILEAIKSFTMSPTNDLDAKHFQCLILVMVTQESGGAVNLVGDQGLSHGLLQVQLRNPDETPVTCDPNSCTKDKIVEMLQQGVYGHSGTAPAEPPGIAFYLGTNGPGASLRFYNTGSLTDPNDYSVTPDLKSTQSYVSDIANRLSGVSPKEFPNKQWLLETCGFQPAEQQ